MIQAAVSEGRGLVDYEKGLASFYDKGAVVLNLSPFSDAVVKGAPSYIGV